MTKPQQSKGPTLSSFFESAGAGDLARSAILSSTYSRATGAKHTIVSAQNPAVALEIDGNQISALCGLGDKMIAPYKVTADKDGTIHHVVAPNANYGSSGSTRFTAAPSMTDALSKASANMTSFKDATNNNGIFLGQLAFHARAENKVGRTEWGVNMIASADFCNTRTTEGTHNAARAIMKQWQPHWAPGA